jgi:isoleucyl-tRNA synthetase
MPYASVGYPFVTQELPPPADFIAEGLDQTRGWFYALLFISTVLFDRIPFKNVIVSGLILAADGKKMSKSLKNYPDPMEIINKYGSDALRLYLLSSNLSNAEPLCFTESDVKLMVRNVIIKLKHAINFYKEYEKMFMLTNPDDKLFDSTNLVTTNILDLYALCEIGTKINEIISFLKKFEITNATKRILQIV